ncbi:vesicular glutamate transporter 2-like isoform X2 [Myzus persicae]|uniref:vesicular glutamate transporter 2-like isoform X2 n=1 Tax=Myzus persicae TaxID=13164 RepID=UPI000B932546|nr:vesicular glutamate transporter 2-like isoform X2 [Myzus persicae]
MDLGEITARKLNSTSQIQSPDLTPSRFMDRFIRLKTRYWNRGFAIVLLTFIGSTIQLCQCGSLNWTYSEDLLNVHYFYIGMAIGYIIGGVLGTVYPAHNIFGVSFIISLICHFTEDMDYSNKYRRAFSIFCAGMTYAIVYAASHGIYSFWIPLDKQSLRHVPIILWKMIFLLYEIITIFGYDNNHLQLGIFGLACFVLWLCVINGDRSQSLKRGFILFRIFRGSNYAPRSSGTSVISLRRSIIMDITWKSFCTSMAVIALVVSYMCSAMVEASKNSFNHYQAQYDQHLRVLISIVLLLLFVLFELVPEITAYFSVTKVRKIFYCAFMFAMALALFSNVLPNGTFLFINKNDLFIFIFNVIPYLRLFSLDINHLDIAPKYASTLIGLQMFMDIFFLYFSHINILGNWSDELLDEIQMRVLVAVVCLASAVFYAIFGSAEIQPRTDDKPVKENQRNMHEEVVLTAV